MTPLSKQELRKQIIKEMCLEEDLQGQLVLKDYEDLVSDWKFCVDNIMTLFETYSDQREVEARDSEQNKMFAVLRHLGVIHDAKEIMRVRKEWDAMAAAHQGEVNRLKSVPQPLSPEQRGKP